MGSFWRPWAILGSLLGTIEIIWGHFGAPWTILGPLLSTIGVIFEHLEFKTSEGDKHFGKVYLFVSYCNAQGPFGLTLFLKNGEHVHKTCSLI